MSFSKSFVIALFVLAVSVLVPVPAAAGDSRAQTAIDPSDVEWTAERYLSARPLDPLRVRSVGRDLPTERLATSFTEGSVGASGRPPTSRSLPQFDLYIHAPGARPRYLTSGARRKTGRQSVVIPGPEGPRENRGSAALEFSSSRLVPTDARVVYPYSTVGKLFFDVPGSGSGYCSASVINRRVVLTAGHCVHTPGKGWHKNFSFVPAFFKGNAPFGTWRAEKIWATGEWINGGNRYPNKADFGVLVMRDNMDGEGVGEVTGWLGWKTRSLSPNHLHILGYPSNLDQGNQLHQVTSSSFDCCFATTAIYGADMRQGSSGGPWVQNFGVRANQQNIGRNTQKNRVVGVYSWLYTNGS
jgi:V8-like Glu-specific endopeptidase